MKDREIIQWAKDRNIANKENHTKQLIKLMEEVGELSAGVLKNKPEEVVDAIGDIGVVLIILSEQLGYNFVECVDKAYEVIKNRTGKTVDGTFIRN